MWAGLLASAAEVQWLPEVHTAGFAGEPGVHTAVLPEGRTAAVRNSAAGQPVQHPVHYPDTDLRGFVLHAVVSCIRIHAERTENRNMDAFRRLLLRQVENLDDTVCCIPGKTQAYPYRRIFIDNLEIGQSIVECPRVAVHCDRGGNRLVRLPVLSLSGMHLDPGHVAFAAEVKEGVTIPLESRDRANCIAVLSLVFCHFLCLLSVFVVDNIKKRQQSHKRVKVASFFA